MIIARHDNWVIFSYNRYLGRFLGLICLGLKLKQKIDGTGRLNNFNCEGDKPGVPCELAPVYISLPSVPCTQSPINLPGVPWTLNPMFISPLGVPCTLAQVYISLPSVPCICHAYQHAAGNLRDFLPLMGKLQD